MDVSRLDSAPLVKYPLKINCERLQLWAPPATALTTQITLVGLTSGKSLGAVAFPSYAQPSRVAVFQGSLFPLGCAVVTDAIGAGRLYLLRQ